MHLTTILNLFLAERKESQNSMWASTEIPFVVQMQDATHTGIINV